MSDAHEMDIEKIVERTKARMDEMNRTAEELMWELGLPPEAKYDVVSILYSKKPTRQLDFPSAGRYAQYAAALERYAMNERKDTAEREPSSKPRQIGHYRIIDELGRGMWGRVYLGRHPDLGILVAIKTLPPLATDEQIERFHREARLIANLDHPHIVRVRDYGVEDGTPYLVMHYATGGTLRQHCPAGTRLPPETVASYIKQIASALQYMHQRRRIHRDVKPENILLDHNTLLLSDFGVAIIVQKSDDQNLEALAEATTFITSEQLRSQPHLITIAGTVPYMAPEQLQGHPLPASDQYSLGIIAYELLSGSRPFKRPMLEIAMQAPPPFQDKILTDDPEAKRKVEQVVLKALEKDPDQRHANVSTFADALVDALRLGPAGTTDGPQPPPPRPWQRRAGWLSALVASIVLIALLGRYALPLVGHNQPPGPPPASCIGIGIHKAADSNECVGISDGKFAFDTGNGRQDGDLKQQAATKLAARDTSGAEALWSEAVKKDTNDSEALIYLENQRVLDLGNPYITIVVGTMLTGDKAIVSVGRDNLQGAYVAQKSFNDRFQLHNGVLVRLLIANSGSNESEAYQVALQIVQAAHTDPTLVGVLGWPSSLSTSDAVDALKNAHIPMVSETVSADELKERPPYFFSVVASVKRQGVVGAQYVEQTLHKKRVALFADWSNPYSSSLANGFIGPFLADGNGNSIVAYEQYSVRDTVWPQGRKNLPTLLLDALSYNPDLIFFAGYSDDVSALLTNLPTLGPFANLQILGGDGLYELGGYSQNARAGFNRLKFTTFAYPDEWQVQCSQGQKFACTPPPFFADYNAYYDPSHHHPSPTYGYTRADSDTILSYDATLAMLTGVNNALTGQKTAITPSELQQGIKAIQGSNSLQGVSGQIAFGTDGNPINKSLVILKVVNGGYFTLVSVQPCFLVGHCG